MEKYEAYSVLITDDKGRRGTGMLFYTEGSDSFYVLTCAHVIYTAESVNITLLVQTKGDPEEKTVNATKDHFHFSPNDQVTMLGDQSTHTCDIAVIECERGNLTLQPAQYEIYPMTSGEEVMAIGYPDGKGPLYYQQSSIYATVEKVLANQTYFLIRLKEKSNINSADREAELKGYSGSPLWDEEKLNEGVYLFGGLIAIGMGTNIRQGRIGVASGKYIRDLLRNEFDIKLESTLPLVTKDEIAPGYEEPVETPDQIAVRNSWVENERRKAQTFVDTLQLKKAIEVTQTAIANSEFQKCTNDQQYRIYAVLLEAYRLGREFEIYDRIREEMHAAGIQNEREIIADAVRYYEAQDNDKAEELIKQALQQKSNGNEEQVLYAVIKAAKGADISILSDIIGPRDQLYIKPKDDREEECIYQILAFALSNDFRETGRAIRCLNRSFQISGNYIILESLAVAYYQHSMRNAIIDIEKDKVDPFRIDQEALDKARDAFLRVLSAADEMWIKGMFSRCGLQLFKCFVFLHDQFRIYKHYHDLIQFYSFENNEAKRDVQLCYIEVAFRKEHINLEEYDALTAHDKKFYELVFLLDYPMRLFGGGLAVEAPISEGKLLEILSEGERRLKALEDSQTDDRLGFDGIHTTFVNLYGNGILRYHWLAIDEVRRHCAAIQSDMGIEALQIYQEELETKNLKLIEQKYAEFFKKKENVLSFEEWAHFYIRHGQFEKAKELYDSVFDERSCLIKIQPEYFYRNYIDYTLQHRFDLTPAIKCFVENKTAFRDIFIYKCFEMDLKFATCTFNDPDMLLEDAKVLLDEGLIGPKDYNQKCLIINMLNCKPEAAEQFAGWAHGLNPLLSTPYERMLLAWKGAQVAQNSHWNSMKKWIAAQMFDIYKGESWLRNPDDILKECRTADKKVIVVDLWTLYYFVKAQIPKVMGLFDTIYITHNSVSMALREINQVNDDDIRRVLIHQIEQNVKLLSPTLEQQLTVRDSSYNFMEIHSACLLAQELNCPIRPSSIKNIVECVTRTKQEFTAHGLGPGLV